VVAGSNPAVPTLARARNRPRGYWTHERPEGFGDCLPVAGDHRVHGSYRRLLLRRVRGSGLPLQPLRGRPVDREESGLAHHATERPFEWSVIPAINDLRIVELRASSSTRPTTPPVSLACARRSRTRPCSAILSSAPLSGLVSPPRRRPPGTRPGRTRLSLRLGAARRAPREG
jgi:hypothetical protein